MNLEQLAQLPNTVGRRIAGAATFLAKSALLGVGGSLLVVESGAFLNHDIPAAVVEADAGTGISGLKIYDAGCNGSGGSPRLVVENHLPEMIDITLTNSKGISTSLIQGPNETDNYPEPTGDTIVTTIKQAPGASDTQTICTPANTTTSTTSTTVKITPSSSTTSTTSNPNTTVTISPIETGLTPVGSATTTTALNQGGKTVLIPTNNADSSEPSTSTTAVGAYGQEQGSTMITPAGADEGSTASEAAGASGQADQYRTLPRTGSEIRPLVAIGGGGAMLGAAGLFVLGLRKRREEQQAAA